MKYAFRQILIGSSWLLAGTLAAQPFTPGETYFSPNGHIEYRCGELPLVIAAPHGGYLQPPDIPDRTCQNAVWTTDANTLELSLAIDSAFMHWFGCRPHLVINHLHRRKLDANRNLSAGACGNPQAITAWNAFHDYINAAKAAINMEYGKGFFVDLHGHGHTIQRLELGYLLYEDELAFSDAVLNTTQYINWSSLRNLAYDNHQDQTHAELLRGPDALGTRLAHQGYPSVPSQQDPFPLPGQPYFSGGYNTVQHSSYLGGTIDGVQIECNMSGVRDTPVNRRRFADSLAHALVDFLEIHYFGHTDFLNCMVTATDGPDREAPALHIHPSPASDHAWVEVPFRGGILRLIDTQGRLVYNQRMEGDRLLLPIALWPSGVYAVVVEGDGVRLVGRVVKH